MKRSILFSVGFITLISVYVVSCKHDPVLPPLGPDNPPIITTNCDPDTVYFQNDVLPIFQSSCAKEGCHDAQTHEEGIDLSTYSSIISTADITAGNPADNKVYESITTGSDEVMPPPPAERLTINQINLIYTWILQGAKNNVCNNSECDSVNVTFSGQIWPLMVNSCKGCHSGNNPGGGVSLTIYGEVKNNATAIWGTINHNNGYHAMPKGGNKLSVCKIAQFKRWMDLGMPGK